MNDLVDAQLTIELKYQSNKDTEERRFEFHNFFTLFKKLQELAKERESQNIKWVKLPKLRIINVNHESMRVGVS